MKKLFLLVILSLPVYASLPNFAKWQVSSGGADTNGGFFVVGSSGTDYSTSDSPHCTATDLVLVTTTTATSATCPFAADSIGNGIYVSAGTGFTIQFCAVTNVVAGTATLQCVAATAGTGGSTGGSFKIGGRLLTISKNLTSLTAGSTTCIKGPTTFTQTSTYTVPSSIASLSWIGFGTTCGDGLSAPTLTTATNSTAIFTFGAVLDAYFSNLILTNTAGTRDYGFGATTSNGGDKLTLDHVTCDGMQKCIYGDFLAVWSFSDVTIRDSVIKNSISHGYDNSGSFHAIRSYFLNNGGAGIRYPANASFQSRGQSTCIDSVFYNNGANGIDYPTPINGTELNSLNCDYVSNTGAGIKITTADSVTGGTFNNNIFYGNTTYGLDLTAPTGTQSTQVAYNACGANTTACYHNITSSVGDVTGISDPFVDKTSNNFAFTAAAITTLGSQGTPGATGNFGTGYLAIGALQPQASSGSANFGTVH